MRALPWVLVENQRQSVLTCAGQGKQQGWLLGSAGQTTRWRSSQQ
jgi:hypothetical protein